MAPNLPAMPSCAGRPSAGSNALHRARQPTQNAFVESFNGRPRDECLLGDPRRIIDACQIYKRGAIWLSAIKVTEAVPFS
jgi:hypothetical protein